MGKSYTAEFKAKVALEAVKGDKQFSELAFKYDVHPSQVTQWKKDLLSNLPDIFSSKKKKQEKQREHTEAKLFEEIGRLKVEVNWLKKNLTSLTDSDRKQMLDSLVKNISISRQCNLLGISRSAYYYESTRSDKMDIQTKRLIDKIYIRHPFKGSRRIMDDKGIDIGRYKVRRLMREMGIHAIYPKKKITTKNKGHKTYPHLLENLDIYKSDLV